MRAAQPHRRRRRARGRGRARRSGRDRPGLRRVRRHRPLGAGARAPRTRSSCGRSRRRSRWPACVWATSSRRPELAPRLDAVRPPASIGVHAAALAEIALRNIDEMRERVRATCAERDRIGAELRARGPHRLAVVHQLRAGRPRRAGRAGGAPAARARHGRAHLLGAARSPSRIRISPATPAENDRLLEDLCGRRTGAPGGGPGAADGRGRAADARDRHPLPGLARRVGRRGGRHRHRHARPHAHRAGRPLADRPRARLLGRPVGGRAPHRRGRRHRARPDARSRARRPHRHQPLRRRPRAARRGGRPRGGRPRRARHRRDRAAACRRARGRAARRRSSPTSSTASSRHGRIGIHLSGTGRDDHHLLEAAFKSLALALRQAWEADPRRGRRRAEHQGQL